ncbi:unnamed protein product [Trypanosoma congolense IL3000]|uniref:WGS project CAEQ00000000 data, annotated contig 2347 n=1 Tax=Trypanosoma congolense (strain IL3000) TaxID=1068625 RepID=F9WDB5_TRYCI|nr:unnamed protein product [Trypanosoma congolense IL3000]
MMSNLDVQTIRGCLLGSVEDALSDHSIVNRILSLTDSFDTASETLTADVRVAYVGTAVYDIPRYREHYTHCFAERGCVVDEVCVANAALALRGDPHLHASACAVTNDQLHCLENAHIVLIPDGNTLYAVRRWEETGLDACLRAIAARGTIIVGGGCWFRAMHSDSANPKTYVHSLWVSENALAAKSTMREVGVGKVESLTEVNEGEEENSWPFICVRGLGALPGIFCACHAVGTADYHKVVESFDNMLKRHPSDRGILLGCTVALLLFGNGKYEVLPVATKVRVPRTLLDGFCLKNVVEGIVRTETPEMCGNVENLFRPPQGPVVRDPFEKYYAMANPTPLSERFSYPPFLCHE